MFSKIASCLRRWRFGGAEPLGVTDRLSLCPLEDRLTPAAPIVITAAGPDRASIQAAVDQFRNQLGSLNPFVDGTQNGGAGRREVNWDDAASSSTDASFFPFDFYNRPGASPRGLEIANQPFNTFYVSPPLTDGVNPEPWHFRPFSSPGVLGAEGSDFKLGGPYRGVPIDFYVPGTKVTGTVRGFGAIFCDIDQQETASHIQFSTADGRLLGEFAAPAAPDGLSFLGVIFDTERVAHASIGLGYRIGTTETFTHDVVALDDLIFGEPVFYSPPPVTQLVAAGAGPGMAPLVQVSRSDGTPLLSFNAFDPAFRGGVHVATGDVSGDSIDDVIVGAGPGGGPHVRTFDGAALMAGQVQQVVGPLGSFYAYDPGFSGGVFVAAGDIYGTDHRTEVVTGAGPGGGPHVKIFDVEHSFEVNEFFAYDPAFRGGVTVACADLDGDLRADVVTGAGPGGGPHVQAFAGSGIARNEIRRLLQPSGSFYAYDPSFTGGVFVAAADTNGDGRAEIITGAGAGGGPHVQVFDSLTLAVRSSFYAFDLNFGGGVRVAAADLNGDHHAELIVGAGAGGEPVVRWLDGMTNRDYFAFDRQFRGGVFVG